ncbi:MAG: hypothetical protein WD468_03560 [Pirellulales bacterium]
MLIAALLLSVLAAVPARAQFGESIPGPEYYAALDAFYMGEYRDAERVLRRETNRGVNSVQGQWIDSVCYHAMLGEVLYQQGRNPEALAEFDQACQLLSAYSNWLLRVNPDPIRPANVTARRVTPWGQSQRQFAPGDVPQMMQIAIGRLDNSQALTQGGIVLQPQYWRINAAEVVRTSALALRRRAELLGPLAPHDPLCRELADVLGRGNLAPANHWTSAWIDLERGLAQAGLGKLDEADTLLGRAAIADGQFDHPLTCVALLEQGRIAMLRGDSRRAAQLLAEASFSAYYYENWEALTESAWLGWLNHITTGGAGVYPPLEPIAAWAQTNRLQHMVVKLRLAQAESLLWLGQLPQATALLADTNRRLGNMRTSLAGIHQLYLQANAQLLLGQVSQGGDLLGQALAAQARGSIRNFQIVRAGQLYDSGGLAPRIATEVYGRLLSDPSPADWVYHPLDAMAVLRSNHDDAFDRWFLAALARKDIPLALEAAEAGKRRRFLSSLPLGGRLAALRTILEAPVSELSPDAVLQRQLILTGYPAYRNLGAIGQKLFGELRAGTILAKDGVDAKSLNDRYDAWSKNADDRESLLTQIALRRLASSLEFPPLRKTAQLQKNLHQDEALVVFHVAANNLYGFLVTPNDVHAWQAGDVRRLRTTVAGLLRELGNYNATRDLSLEDLKNDRWRVAATEIDKVIFGEAHLDLAKTKSLAIVPDDVLWYLPFEALVPTGPAPPKVLADLLTIRYAPTASLAVGDTRPFRPAQHTGLVANEFVADKDAGGSVDALQELEQVVAGPVLLPTPLPEPGRLVATLLDELIVLDDVEPARDGGYGWSPLQRSKGAADDTLAKWFALPYGGPERIVLTGFPTAAEQGLKGSRRTSSRGGGGQPGSEIFQSVCGLMANGARTILLSRWRTGGRTNFDLVREFVQELPNSPAADAWQRACILAREAPLDAAREPRLKRPDAAADMPTAEHPFFWAGYLLVDSSPRIADEVEPKQVEPKKEEMLADGKQAPAAAEKDAPDADAKMPLPPPDKPVDTPAVESPATEKSP